jgi:hypothetical protein
MAGATPGQAAAIVAAATALAACGGGGNERLSAADFAKRGNAICRKYETKMHGIPRPRTLDEAAQYFEQTAPLAKQEAAEFEQLEPPVGEEGAYRRLLRFIHASERIALRFEAAAKAHDAERAAEVQWDAQNLDPRGVAQALGLTDCARAA